MIKFLQIFLLFPCLFYGQNTTVTIDIPAPICNVGDCVSLNANYTNNKATDSYTVSSIPYIPFAYNGGTIVSSGDDVWSSYITIPFQFNFYGNCYNSLLIGSNGLITFDLSTFSPNTACFYSYSQTIPNTLFPIRNSIYGVFQDLNPSYATNGQNINYHVFGTSPNRIFVINFNELPQYYNQVVDFQTSQIVLYESSNIIDINIKKRTPNNGWNSGNGLVGIQNQTGTSAYSPAGRNTGNWSATNESWRFTPNGATTSQLVWKKNGIEIGSQNPIIVCYDQPNDVYQASVTYNGCTSFNLESSTSLTLNQFEVNNPSDLIVCSNDTTATFNLDQTSTILSGLNPDDYIISYYLTNYDATIDSQSISNPTTFVSTSSQITIYARIENQNTGCAKIKSFNLNIVPLLPMPTGDTIQNFIAGQTLADLIVNGTNIHWYDSETNGNMLPTTTLLVNNTTYYCTQSNEYGCENARNTNSTRLPVTVHETLGNNDFYFQNLKIQPNPVKDIFTISNQNNLDLVEIYNTIEQKIISKKVNDNQVKLDLSNYNSGVYFVKVYSENQNKTIKIIKN